MLRSVFVSRFCMEEGIMRFCLIRTVTKLIAVSLPAYAKSMLTNVQNPCRRVSKISLGNHNHVFDANLKKNLLSWTDGFVMQNYYQKVHEVSSSMQYHSFIPPRISKLEENLVTDPEELIRNDLPCIFKDIKEELVSFHPEFKEIADYYFDGKEHALYPTVVILMARCINTHIDGSLSIISPKQWQIAIVVEMLYFAGILHDDVMDSSDTRNGKPSVNNLWGQRKAILSGDYAIGTVMKLLAKLDNKDVSIALSQGMVDFVHGEFLQLDLKQEENERFSHYMLKTFKKIASLFAHGCQAVAILASADKKIQDIAFNYGKNLGLVFQLIDDVLDFDADLRSGLTTAPILFACEKFPELNPMIMRRFSQSGDVQKAFDIVLKSDGIEQTRFLAQKHCQEAVKYIQQLSPSSEQKALIKLTDRVLNRVK